MTVWNHRSMEKECPTAIKHHHDFRKDHNLIGFSITMFDDNDGFLQGGTQYSCCRVFRCLQETHFENHLWSLSIDFPFLACGDATNMLSRLGFVEVVLKGWRKFCFGLSISLVLTLIFGPETLRNPSQLWWPRSLWPLKRLLLGLLPGWVLKWLRKRGQSEPDARTPPVTGKLQILDLHNSYVFRSLIR